MIVKYLTKDDGLEKEIVKVLSVTKYVASHKDNINKDLLRGIITNIVGTVITIDTIIHLMKDSKIYTQSDILDIYDDVIKNNVEPVSYEVLESYGLIRSNDLGVDNLKKEIDVYTKKLRFDRSGFKKVKDKYTLEPIKFANYFYSRVEIVSISSEHFYIYTTDGVWESADKYTVSRITTYLMNELSLSLWKMLHGAQVFTAIQMTCKRITKMDTYRNLMNLNNGMLDLDTFELVEHDKEYYSSVRIDIQYAPNAICDRFRLYMKQITCGDEKLEMVMQEILGYCLTSETRAEKAFIFYGRGSNGKSVFAKIITMLAGRPNVSNIPLREFGVKFGMETIVGKIVNIATETELDDFKLNTENFKSVTSGDSLHIQRKHKTGIDIDPMVKLVFLTNNLPRVNDTTKGFLRKILIVPFNAEFTYDSSNAENKLDNRLIEKLETEKEGILLYALEGLKRLKENGFKFTESEVINNAIKEYEREINPTIEFFEDNIEISNDASIHRPEVVSRFKSWASYVGKQEWINISPQKFWVMFEQTMAKNGVKYNTKKVSGNIKVLGIKFKQSNIVEENLDDLIFEFVE